MAGKALAAFVLLATLLQVRARVFCYHTNDCDESQRFNATSERDCCLGDLTEARSYFDGSSCQPCVVYNISDVSVEESRGTVTLAVSLVVGTLDRNVDINYKTVEVDSNTSNVDYTESTGTLTLDRSPTDNTITIDIIDDDLVEVNEFFRVVLEPPNGQVVLLRDSATVTIEDDDGKLTLSFFATTSTSESWEVYDYGVTADKQWGSPMGLRVFTSTETATSGYAQEVEDFEPIDKIVTLIPGESLVRYFEGPLVDDNYYEMNEKFYISMEVPEKFSSKIDLISSKRTVTIRDNDDLDLGFKYLMYTVGEGEGSLEFEVEPKNNVQFKVPVTFNLTDHQGSALRGIDYNNEKGNHEVQLLPGAQNVLRIEIIDDTETELNETFTLSLKKSEKRVNIHPDFTQTVVTIVDNDVLTIELRTEQTSVAEDHSSPISISVHALGSVPAPVILTVSSVPHNKHHYATEGDDYVGFSATLTLMPGENPSNSTTVTILDDPLLELFEEVFEIKMELAAQSPFIRVRLMSTPRNITIRDNEVLEIGFKAVSYSVGEGDGSFVFDVEVKNNVSFVMPIVYALNDIGGEALRNKDYIVVETPEQRLNPGQMSIQHAVKIIDDNETERLHETFALDLTPVTERVRVTPSLAQLAATITDDDEVTIDFEALMTNVYESVGSVQICMSIVEGKFAADKDVTLVLQTMDGTASAPDDYEPIDHMSIRLTKDVTSSCVDITIKDENNFEQNETFLVTLTSDDPSVKLESDEIEITIMNDDIMPLPDLDVTMQIPDSVNENGGSFEVSLIASRAVKSPVKLRVFTVPNSMSGFAEVGEDYMQINETVTLMRGETLLKINVTVIDDNIMEDLEVLEIRMELPQQDSLPFDVNLIDQTQGIQIQDDEVVQIGFNESSYTAYEEKGNLTFGVELKNTVMSAIPIKFTVMDVEGSALRDEDYEGISVELKLVPEQTSYPYSISIDNDFKVETDETFTLVLQTEQNRVSIPSGMGEVTVTIIDGPSARIGFAQEAYSVTESSATNPVTEDVCVSILDGSIASVTITLQSMNETAKEDEDYEPFKETVTLTSQTRSHCVRVVIKGDDYFEAHETFAVELTSEDPSVLLDPSKTQITIMNDEELWLEMYSVETAVSESKKFVYIEVIADRIVEAHVDVRLFPAPSDKSSPATEGEDYVDFNQTVPLELGRAATLVVIEDALIDDKILENTQEVFLIRMEVPNQPMSDMIHIIDGEDHDEVTILDSGDVEIGFTKRRYIVNEEKDNVVVEVELKDNFTTAVDIPFFITVTEGSAHNITDFIGWEVVKLKFTPDQKIVKHRITIVSDDVPEKDETFTLSLSERRARVIINPNFTQANVTITEVVRATVGFDKTVYSVSESASHANVCLRILNGTLASDKNITVMLQSSDGTATASSDYTAVSRTIVLTSENQMPCVDIEIKQDETLEMDETLTLRLTSDMDTVTLDPHETEITIENDDEVNVTFTAAHYTYQESSGNATVTLNFTGETAVNVLVRVKGGPTDQTNIGDDKVTFTRDIIFNGRGPTVENVVGTIVDDEIALEADEIVNVGITDVSPIPGVNVGLQTTVVTIIDDDPLSAFLSKSEDTVNEDVGMVKICVNKTLRTIPALEFSLQTRDGSATAGSDYIGLTNSIITIAGSDKQGCLSVVVINDTEFEGTEENFFVDLMSSNSSSVTLDLIETEIKIIDNDGVRVSFTSNQYMYHENEGMADVEIVLTGETARDVVVSVKGDASQQTTVGTDRVVFEEMNITFTADGPKKKNVSAVILNDEVALEDDELVSVDLKIVSPTSGVHFGSHPTTVVTIVDDELLSAYFEQPDINVSEDNGMAEICVQKSHQTIPDLVFYLNSRDGSATAGSDYIGLTNSTITIEDNDMHGCLSVEVINDIRLEQQEEDFFVDLSYLGKYKVNLGQSETEITIVDDDEVLVGFEKDQDTYDESAGQVEVVVVLTGETDLSITVSIMGGPSSQTDIGPDRVQFNRSVTFTPGGSKEDTVSATVINDDIALEASEIVDVSLSIISPMSRVSFDDFPTTVVTIHDDDLLTAKFTKSKVNVNESDGTVDICVKKSLHTIPDVEFTINSHGGNATAGVDYNLLVSTITIQANDLETCSPSVQIVDDDQHETTENFYVTLAHPGADVSVVSPSSMEVLIFDNDTKSELTCTLSDSLILHPFSRDMQSSKSFSIDQGCEHTLVKTCEGSTMDLEIRVDFFQNDFNSTKVAISFEGERVIINEDFSLKYNKSQRIVVNQLGMDNTVVVSIPEIELTVTRSLADLTVKFGEVDIQLSGLCGTLGETLVFPDCVMTLDTKDQLDSFIRSYKIKPSDQILRGERKECGGTAKDTVIQDPVMIVPVHAPDFDSDIYLCYEIHGDADKYFNLVSDDCTTVNAHYSQAPAAATINIIDSINIVAVDNQGNCQKISVDVDGCLATVDGVTLQPMSEKRSIGTHDKHGISVRSYSTRARITVPNCADNKLVMWVICENTAVYDGHNNVYTDPMNMIKFEITRGLNLHEYSHGLLGQFWNIPVTIKFHTEIAGSDYYNVTVSHPSSKPRSFSGLMHSETWDSQQKQCLYVGNLQGGSSHEVPGLEDSVIEGLYTDYVVDSEFETQFRYAVFEQAKCD